MVNLEARAPAKDQCVGVEVQDLVGREVDHAYHRLPLCQALEGRAVRRKHLPLCSGELRPGGVG